MGKGCANGHSRPFSQHSSDLSHPTLGEKGIKKSRRSTQPGQLVDWMYVGTDMFKFLSLCKVVLRVVFFVVFFFFETQGKA